MPQRKILDHGVQPVALHVVRLERGRSPGRMRVAMLHHSLAARSGIPSPPSARAAPDRCLRSTERSSRRSRRSRSSISRRYKAADPLGNSASLDSANSSGGWPWPRCLLDPSAAISMPAESRTTLTPAASAMRTWLANIPARGCASAPRPALPAIADGRPRRRSASPGRALAEERKA